jgi:hypothetical protein
LAKNVAVHPIAPGFLEIATRIPESFRDNQLQPLNLEFLNVHGVNQAGQCKAIATNQPIVSFRGCAGEKFRDEQLTGLELELGVSRAEGEATSRNAGHGLLPPRGADRAQATPSPQKSHKSRSDELIAG